MEKNSEAEKEPAPTSTKPCAVCNSAIPEAAKFCLECGAAQNPAAEAQSTDEERTQHESINTEIQRVEPIASEVSGSVFVPEFASLGAASTNATRNRSIIVGIAAIVLIAVVVYIIPYLKTPSTAEQGQSRAANPIIQPDAQATPARDYQLPDGTKFFGERRLKDGTVKRERVEFPNGQKDFDVTRLPDGTAKIASVELPNGSQEFNVTILPDGTEKVGRHEFPNGVKFFDLTTFPDGTKKQRRVEFPDGTKVFDVTILPDGTTKFGRRESPDGQVVRPSR